MSLAVIEKYAPEKDGKKAIIKINSVLTHEERELLAEFFILDGVITRENKKRILTLCRSIHERDLWVQCDCVASLKPIFRFNRAPSGTLYLHHITSRGEHAKGCVFKERLWEGANTSKEKPRIKKSGALYLMTKKIKEDKAEKPLKTESQKRGTGTNRSKLSHALYLLLDDAGVNCMNPSNKKVPIHSIEQAASLIELLPKKRMSDYLYMNPSLVFKAAYALRNDQTPWPKDTRKHALMLVKVQSFDDHILEAIKPDGTTQTLKISNRIYRSSGRFGARTAPFMAFILISDSVEKPNFYEPVKAYITPCYSEKTFIPVDSHYERELLRRLFALQFERSKQGRSFEIIKPLFHITVHQGTPDEACVLPDFLIKTQSKQLVIEVNGSHEPEYLHRKERVHQMMSSLGILLSIDAYGAEKNNQLNQRMNELLAQLKQHLD